MQYLISYRLINLTNDTHEHKTRNTIWTIEDEDDIEELEQYIKKEELNKEIEGILFHTKNGRKDYSEGWSDLNDVIVDSFSKFGG